MLIHTKFITLRNGKKIYAYEKGLECFCFEVDESKQEEYLKRKSTKPKK